jgi:hypothetical protein
MPSPSATFQIVGGVKVFTLQWLQPMFLDPTSIKSGYFRTAFFNTAGEATENADAGDLYFVAAVDAAAGSGAVTYDDNNPLEGTDQIEVDNFGIPTFRYYLFRPLLVGLG